MNNKIKFNSYLILGLIFLSSCLGHHSCPEYDSIYAFAKEHAKEEGWQLGAIGAFGFKGYSGPAPYLIYRGRDIYEIPEARDIAIRNLINFMAQNRENQKLIKKVDKKNGQLSYRNIELLISIYHENYNNTNGTIGLISFKENTIRYWRYDETKDDLILVYKEPINEALRLSPECTDKSIIYEDPDYPPFVPLDQEKQKPQKVVIIHVDG